MTGAKRAPLCLTVHTLLTRLTITVSDSFSRSMPAERRFPAEHSTSIRLWLSDSARRVQTPRPHLCHVYTVHTNRKPCMRASAGTNHVAQSARPGSGEIMRSRRFVLLRTSSSVLCHLSSGRHSALPTLGAPHRRKIWAQSSAVRCADGLIAKPHKEPCRECKAAERCLRGFPVNEADPPGQCERPVRCGLRR